MSDFKKGQLVVKHSHLVRNQMLSSAVYPKTRDGDRVWMKLFHMRPLDIMHIL